jgi:hypothetical protein
MIAGPRTSRSCVRLLVVRVGSAMQHLSELRRRPSLLSCYRAATMGLPATIMTMMCCMLTLCSAI